MKNLKKLISVIIAVIMIVGSFATVSAADYKDVESTSSFAKAINVLSGLGIVTGDDEGNFNPKNEIKRSEMVALVCRMMGEEDIATNSASNAFTDVAANHWAAGYIAWGVNRGIVNGMGDGTFAPDASVSYQDSVVMIMRALGYDRIAQRAQNGGYPAGYLKLASQRSILKDAGYDNQAAAPREVVAQLIYNAMTAPLVDVKQYGMNVEDDRYIIHDGSDDEAPLRTLLTYTNDIIKVKAEITASAKTNDKLIDKDGNYKVDINVLNGYGYKMDEISQIFREEDMGKDEKAFAVTGVYVGDTNAADLLGATVEAYLVEDEDLNAWKLLAVVGDAKAVKSETIKATEADFSKAAYKATLFTYEDAEGNEEEIDLVAEADLILYYNGKEIGKATKFEAGVIEKLLKEANEITFAGSKTSDYSKIFITTYDYMVVNRVYADEFAIYGKGLKVDNYVSELILDTEVNDKLSYNIYDAKGAALKIEDIKEYDVLNIVAPKDVDSKGNKTAIDKVNYYDIYVTNEVVSGSISEDFLDGYRFAIDGTTYKTVAKNGVASGEEGDFYLTIDGRILYKDASKSISKDFAFIVRAYTKVEYGTEKINYVGLFTADGEINNYEVADKLTVDGKLYEGEAIATYIADVAKLVEAQAKKEDAEANVAKRFATYKLNSNNQIKELTFYSSTEEATYRENFGTLAGKEFDDATKVFVAPVKENADKKFEVDKDDIKLGSFASMKDKEKYVATIVELDPNAPISAVLLNKDVVSDFAGSHLAVVLSKGQSYDAESAETLTKYTLLQSGETISLAISADAEAANVDKELATGDVILYSVDAKGDIENMHEVLKGGTFDAGVYKIADVEKNEFALVYGEITNINDAYTRMTAAGATGAFGDGEGNTYASIDYTDGSFNEKDIKAMGGYEGLRYESSTKTYKVVAIYTEDEVFEDCIMIITNKEGK